MWSWRSYPAAVRCQPGSNTRATHGSPRWMHHCATASSTSRIGLAARLVCLGLLADGRGTSADPDLSRLLFGILFGSVSRGRTTRGIVDRPVRPGLLPHFASWRLTGGFTLITRGPAGAFHPPHAARLACLGYALLRHPDGRIAKRRRQIFPMCGKVV